MKETYLITGGAGAIGANLVRELVNQDHAVLAVIRSSSNLWRLEDFKEKIGLVECELDDPDQVNYLFNEHRPDHVVNLAGTGIYPYQYQAEDRSAREQEIRRTNERITENILEAFKRNPKDIKSFIQAGTVFEYGSRPGQVKESDIDIGDILNSYSAAKIRLTTLCAEYVRAYSLPINVLRLFTAYGPFEDPIRAIEATILRALSGAPIKVVSGVTKDFIYISDMVSAIISTSQLHDVKGEIINIGSGYGATLEEMANLVKEITGSNSEIILDESYRRKKDSSCFADIEKAKKLLDWQPEHSLKEGLLKTVDWYKENKHKIPQELIERLNLPK